MNSPEEKFLSLCGLFWYYILKMQGISSNSFENKLHILTKTQKEVKIVLSNKHFDPLVLIGYLHE